MSGWIKWEKDLETDPRFVRLVRHVRNRCVTDASHAALAPSLTAGALLRFWVYADTHIRENDQLDLGLEDIDDLVGLSGFSEGMPEDWLVVVDDTTVELPGYQEHNGVAARKRDLAQKRMQRKRLRDRDATVTQEGNASVTGASPDQTRPDQKKKKSSPDGEPKENGSRSARPASRLPADFNLTDKRRAYASEQGVDPDRTFENFCDYWRAASGAKARKHDWDATWRMWCRRESEGTKNGTSKPGRKPSAVERAKRATGYGF